MKCSCLPAGVLAGLAPAVALAWTAGAGVESTALRYQGSALREQLVQQKLDLTLQASPDLWTAVTLGESTVGYRQGPALRERGVALSLGGALQPPGLSLTWRLNGLRVQDRQDGLADARAYSAGGGLGWWWRPDRLLDAGLQRTVLDDGLRVDQFTPMAGASLDNQYTWIQLRACLQRYSATTEGLDRSASAELKLTRWLQPGSALKPRTLQAMLQGGKRLYAVDTDAGELYNLPYVQTAGGWAGAGWALGRSADLLLLAGASRAHSTSLADDLGQRFLYLNLNTHW